MKISKILPIVTIGLFSFAVYSSVDVDTKKVDQKIDSLIWGEWVHSKGLSSAIVETNCSEMVDVIQDDLVSSETNFDHELVFQSDGSFVLKVGEEPPITGRYTCTDDGELVINAREKLRVVMDDDVMMIVSDVAQTLDSAALKKCIDSHKELGKIDPNGVVITKAMVLTMYVRP